MARRPMVRGGFKRRNAPRNDDFNPDDVIDWTYSINNEELKRITNTTDIKTFCKIQHLKYVAHVMRSDNDCLQKQFLFCNAAGNKWRKLASDFSIDEQQLRRMMMVKKDLHLLLKTIK